MKTIKNYTELSKLNTFIERFNYLKLNGKVGLDTFGHDRYLNQRFYKTREWKAIRDYVIVRDMGCDLGIDGYEIYDKILVHHMNPISLEDILQNQEHILDPEYLICVSEKTHQAIHYGDEKLLPKDPIIRYKNDTTPWKTKKGE